MLKKNFITFLRLFKFLILKKGTITVFNTEKVLHHFLTTLKVFNLKKGSIASLRLLKVLILKNDSFTFLWLLKIFTIAILWNAGEQPLLKVAYHIIFMINKLYLVWVPNFTALGIYFLFGTNFSRSEGTDTCFNVE